MPVDYVHINTDGSKESYKVDFSIVTPFSSYLHLLDKAFNLTAFMQNQRRLYFVGSQFMLESQGMSRPILQQRLF